VLLLPQERRGVLAIDGTVHGLLEKNGCQDLVPGEARTRHQALTHLVDEIKHLLVAVVGVLGNPV